MREISRRERLLIFTVAIGLMALVVDRLWLAPDAVGGATLPAGLRPPRAAAFAAGDLALDLPQPASAPTVPDDLPDVFLRTRLFPDGLPAAGAGPDGATSALAAPPAMDRFIEQHRLQGVVLGPRPLAVIDDRTVRIGDRIDGAVVIAIRPREVELTLEGRRILLPLAAHR